MRGNDHDLQARMSDLESEVRAQRDVIRRQAGELCDAAESLRALEKLATERQRRIDHLEARLGQYEPIRPTNKNTEGEGAPGQEAPDDETPPDPTRYSVEDEEKRNQPKRRAKSRGGRKPLAEKIAQTARRVPVYPEGKSPEECRLHRTRVGWRLEDGKAVYIAYDLYAPLDGGPPAEIPELGKDGEYGIEWPIILAYLMYVIGMSMDRAVAVIRLFTGLPLRKSQADALLNRLTRDWEAEFDELCGLLAYATVVHIDESGWKVGTLSRSVWVFLTEQVCVLLFGKRKDLETLQSILDPETFDGVVVTDDASVYRDRFKQAQKCWAHLLRKAIKLTLLYPHVTRYRDFLQALLEIYRDAKRAAADKRLKENGRRRRALELEERLWKLCGQYFEAEVPEDATADERAFINLNKELLHLDDVGELFLFVRNPEVSPTNMSAERAFRFTATERAAGRTSKSGRGAHRRSVLGTVLTSLSMQWEHFTFSVLIEHVLATLKSGERLFARWFSPPSELCKSALPRGSPEAAAA